MVLADMARKLQARHAAALPWTRRRIAGETLLALTLAGLAVLLDPDAGSNPRTVAVAVSIAALSLTRRPLPATVLIVSATLAGQMLAAVPLMVCAGWSAGRRVVKPGRALATCAVAFVLYVAPSMDTELLPDAGLSLLVTGALSGGMFLVLVVVPALVARHWAVRRALLDALLRHNTQLVREQAMVADQARLMERNRIAHDMHDSLGHQLALISMQAGALQVDWDLTERQQEGVRVLRDASVTAMRELRETVGILQGVPAQGGRDSDGLPPWPGEIPAGSSPTRVVAAIDVPVEASRAAGATVELRRSGTVRPLAPAADHAAYRIAQEGLTNAHKHAPGAHITVALRYEPDSLVVEVVNGPVPNGVPAPVPKVAGGQGLTGLRERARLVGGLVHCGLTPDGGFRLAGVLPYQTGDGGPPPDPQDATSVAGENDFGEQNGDRSAAQGGSAVGRSDPQKEFATIMSHKKNIAIGCGVIAVVILLGLVALATWGFIWVKGEWEKATISPSVYESVQEGDAERDVQAKLPDEDSQFTKGVEEQGPPRPKGATCRHFGSSDTDDFDTVYRFCFDDGKLVEKLSFQAQ